MRALSKLVGQRRLSARRFEAGSVLSTNANFCCSRSALGLAPKQDAGTAGGINQVTMRTGSEVPTPSQSAAVLYEDQRREAKRRAKDFTAQRLPKFLGYFEQVLKRNGGRVLAGNALSYVDLSLFQMIEGLRYAFHARWPNRNANIGA